MKELTRRGLPNNTALSFNVFVMMLVSVVVLSVISVLFGWDPVCTTAVALTVGGMGMASLYETVGIESGIPSKKDLRIVKMAVGFTIGCMVAVYLIYSGVATFTFTLRTVSVAIALVAAVMFLVCVGANLFTCMAKLLAEKYPK